MKLIEAIIRAAAIDEVNADLQTMGVGEIGIGEILVSRLSGNDQNNGIPCFTGVRNMGLTF